MMRLFLFIMMFSISLFSTDLTFQVYVFDDSSNDLLQSDDVVAINAMFVDSNDVEYENDYYEIVGVTGGILKIFQFF